MLFFGKLKVSQFVIFSTHDRTTLSLKTVLEKYFKVKNVI